MYLAGPSQLDAFEDDDDYVCRMVAVMGDDAAVQTILSHLG